MPRLPNVPMEQASGEAPRVLEKQQGVSGNARTSLMFVIVVARCELT